VRHLGSCAWNERILRPLRPLRGGLPAPRSDTAGWPVAGGSAGRAAHCRLSLFPAFGPQPRTPRNLYGGRDTPVQSGLRAQLSDTELLGGDAVV